MKPYLLIAGHNAHTIGVLLTKFFPVPLSSKIFSNFSSIECKVSDRMVTSFVHLVWSFVQGGR